MRLTEHIEPGGNNQALVDIDVDTDDLEFLRKDFQRTLTDQPANVVNIYCNNPPLLTDENGINCATDLSHDINHGVDANHLDICRFKSQDDDGYVQFLSNIQRPGRSVQKRLHGTLRS